MAVALPKLVAADPMGGGLGNLLFQHHAAYAAALRAGARLGFRTDYFESTRAHVTKYASELFKHVWLAPLTEMQSAHGQCAVWSEPGFTHSAVPRAVPSGVAGLLLRGYLQSFKYFEDVLPQLRAQLRINAADRVSRCVERVKGLCGGSRVPVCVHVRRTDYLALPDYHPVATQEYYAKALKALEIESTVHQVLVFSDDPAAVADWSLWWDYSATIVDAPDEQDALWMMASCKKFVLANSSLSLNAFLLHQPEGEEEAKLYAAATAPAKWFGPKGPHFSMGDLVPPGVIVI